MRARKDGVRTRKGTRRPGNGHPVSGLFCPCQTDITPLTSRVVPTALLIRDGNCYEAKLLKLSLEDKVQSLSHGLLAEVIIKHVIILAIVQVRRKICRPRVCLGSSKDFTPGDKKLIRLNLFSCSNG